MISSINNNPRGTTRSERGGSLVVEEGPFLRVSRNSRSILYIKGTKKEKGGEKKREEERKKEKKKKKVGLSRAFPSTSALRKSYRDPSRKRQQRGAPPGQERSDIQSMRCGVESSRVEWRPGRVESNE